MKRSLLDFILKETREQEEYDIPYDHTGSPLILPDEVWQKTVINFDRLIHRRQRNGFSRVPCRGSIILLNKDGKIVTKGYLRDLSKKSGGFESDMTELKEKIRLGDVLFLQLPDRAEFNLMQTKVVLKRLQIEGNVLRMGVEFKEVTPAFQDKLQRFLVEMRKAAGFTEIETI